MQCNMCGKDTELFIATIEGTELEVCKDCAKFGKNVKKIKKKEHSNYNQEPISFKKKRTIEEEVMPLILSNYSQLIKNAREKKGLKQEEFAKMVNEKASLIHSFESGKLRPSINVAKKLERFLKIKLIEEIKKDESPSFLNEKDEKTNGNLTIGDLIKIKKK
jgi:putative transcription factor